MERLFGEDRWTHRVAGFFLAWLLGGVGVMVLALLLAPPSPPDPVAIVAPGSTQSVRLRAGAHQLSWRGDLRRTLPRFAQVEITAVDPATGSSADAVSTDAGICAPAGSKQGRCHFGILVAPTDGVYDVRVVVSDIEVSHGELQVHERLGSPPTEWAKVVATMAGVSAAASFGLLVWLWSRRHRPWTN